MDGDNKNIEELNNAIAAKKVELVQVRGTSCAVYTRIVGYYRAVHNWNKGKSAERTLRKNYVVS